MWVIVIPVVVSMRPTMARLFFLPLFLLFIFSSCSKMIMFKERGNWVVIIVEREPMDGLIIGWINGHKSEHTDLLEGRNEGRKGDRRESHGRREKKKGMKWEGWLFCCEFFSSLWFLLPLSLSLKKSKERKLAKCWWSCCWYERLVCMLGLVWAPLLSILLSSSLFLSFTRSDSLTHSPCPS